MKRASCPRHDGRFFYSACLHCAAVLHNLLYLRSAKGELGASHAGSLVDFARKTGADLALLEAKAGKPKRRQSSGNSCSSDQSSKKNWRRRTGGSSRRDDGERSDDTEDDLNTDSDDGGDAFSAEVSITDEFGRDRTVERGGPEHRAYLEAKKAAAEEEAEHKAQAEAYDERYSYRGNKGSAPPPSNAGASAGGWAWSSGAGRGADEGDFETRDGQERRAQKRMTELLQQEGGGDVGKNEGGAKVCACVRAFIVRARAFFFLFHCVFFFIEGEGDLKVACGHRKGLIVCIGVFAHFAEERWGLWLSSTRSAKSFQLRTPRRASCRRNFYRTVLQGCLAETTVFG